MKKILLYMVAILFIFTGCSDNSVSSNIESKDEYISNLILDTEQEVSDYSYIKGYDFNYAAFEISYDNDVVNYQIIILEDEKIIDVIHSNKDENVSLVPSVETLVIETDINFDDKNDILIHKGSFGAQGTSVYTCFIRSENGFIELGTEVPNLSIDKENEVLLGTNRNSAGSYSYFMYRFTQNNLVNTDILTVNFLDEDIVEYTDEVFKDGHWQIRLQMTTENLSEEEIDKVFSNESTYWAINSDKWKTLGFSDIMPEQL